MIGVAQGNKLEKTPGTVFASNLIERFTEVEGNKSEIYYTMSTWRPYTVVKIKSAFAITSTANQDGDHDKLGAGND